MQLTFSCILCESSMISRDYLFLCLYHKRKVDLLNRAFANSDLFNVLFKYLFKYFYHKCCSAEMN